MKLYKCIFAVLIFSLLTAGSLGAEEMEAASGPDLSGITVLDLETAQRFALESNPSVNAALERVEQARARIRQAQANWWPSVDATGSGGRTRLSDSSFLSSQAFAFLGNQATDNTYEEYRLGLQASWVLFDGFYRSFKVEQSRLNKKSFEASRVDVRRLLASAVAEAFLNAQLAQTNVKIAQADSDFYTRQLEDAQNRYDVGAGPWGDILNIKVQLNSAKTNYLLATREYEAAGYGLAALMGIPEAEFPQGVTLSELETDFTLPEKEKEPGQLIETALDSRPDVRQLSLQVKEAEAGIGLAKAPFYPSVQLMGGVNGYSQDDIGMSGDDFGNTISLNVSWNLFAGGEDEARKVEAEHGYREAKYSLANLRNEVASEVRQAVVLVAAAREQVVLQRESVKLVEENRELAKSEYEAGEASLVRLNEAQRDLTTTYSRLAQAVVAYYRAEQRLLTATGRNVEGYEESGAMEN